MSQDYFDSFAPYIQDYIRRAGWQELRPVQIGAAEVLFESDSHLLLTAGTAAGKTEAAFLPILSLLEKDQLSSIGVLYIGPLKALINDQFERLDHLLKEGRVPVHAWHGDIEQSRKARTLREPRGILQITPESMEGMFLYRSNLLHRLFHDLRFIVIDEVHSFMSSDRGIQVLCQLQRLAPYMASEPRRVGLSATLGDKQQAENWLASGSAKLVITPDLDGGASRNVRLSVDYFEIPKPTTLLEDGDEEDEPEEGSVFALERFGQYLWHETYCRSKVLIFANSRSETENCVAKLRDLASRQNLPDDYFVHHGNIAKPLREDAERAMKEDGRRAVTAATLTLELGIDIGQLDRVLQLGSPNSVSSFIQRLGRSGRRGTAAEMFISVSQFETSGEDSWPQQIPWELIQAISIIQLYIEERWVEPAENKPYPYSLLYHQTMSILASQGEMAPAALASRVLKLAPFAKVPQEDFRELLLHLLESEHLERTPEGGLIVGLAGEPVVNHYTFLAVFKDSDSFTVKDGSNEIGSLDILVPVGERFRLAGRTWEVKDFDLERKVIFVFSVRGKSDVQWTGESGNIHTKVLKRMRRVLLESQEFSYLQEHGRRRLAQARQLAHEVGMGKSDVLPLGPTTVCVLPWVGSRSFLTLLVALSKGVVGGASSTITPFGSAKPYFMEVKYAGSPEALKAELKSMPPRIPDPVDLLVNRKHLEVEKFDRYIPPALLKKAYAWNVLDLEELSAELPGLQ